MTAAPLRAVPAPTWAADLETSVRRAVELQQRIDELGAEMTQVRKHLAEIVPVGSTVTTSFGVKVTVTGPSRRFDLRTAVELLRHKDPDALERCKLDGYDSAKIKKALPGELVDVAMIAGTGAPVVRIS